VTDSHEMRSEVRAAGVDLVADLQRARRISSDWSRGKLADEMVDSALARCLGRLAATGCWGPDNRLPSGELWRVAGPLLQVGSLQHHARFKPHGYAGDHEMLSRICERSCCDDPLGRVFDRYFLRQAAPAAVRSRTRQMAAMLASDSAARDGAPFHVVSVGSGPGIDVSDGLRLLPAERRGEVRVTLIDLAPDALDCARQRIEPLLPPQRLRCVRTNLFRLPDAPDPDGVLGRADLLICTGLFDYLDDAPAAAMLRFFRRQLTPGGRLLVGNFAPDTPTRAYMEWIGNWYLTYRTAEQLDQLAAAAELRPGDYSIGCEETGTDLFLTASRPG